MHTKKILLAIVAALALAGAAFAADSNKRLFDREQLQISASSATITIASPTSGLWTSYNPIITIAPESNHALYNTRIVIDLQAVAGTGFAANYTSQTITFIVSRKVDGSNWRQAASTATTAVSGTNSVGTSVEIELAEVGPTEQVRIEVKLSGTLAGSNIVLPYVLYYRAGAKATLTNAS